MWLGGRSNNFRFRSSSKEAIQTLHQAILCGLVVSGDVFHVAAPQNEPPRPARSRPSNRQRFSRPDHGIRLPVFYLTHTDMECVTFQATKLFDYNERLFLTEPCRSPTPTSLAPV